MTSENNSKRKANYIGKPVKGYGGLYTVFSNGRVYSERRKIFLVNFLSKRTGGLQVRLCNKGKTKTLSVHRVVAEAFLPNPQNKSDVNHIDGNRHNNSVENLEWATRSENMQHAVRTGLWKPRFGEANPVSKLSLNTVLEIRSKYRTGKYNYPQLARIYGVSKSAICRIVLRQNWRDI